MSVPNEGALHFRSYAKIDLDAIDQNLEQLKAKAGDGVRLMAVIKADAYSEGAERIARELENKVDYFGVAVVDEAVALRESGIKTPILILSYTLPYYYHLLLKYDITQTVSAYDEAKLLSDIAVSFGRTARVHIAVDTGMSRIGFSVGESDIEAIKRIFALPNIFVEGIFSHYARADESDTTAADLQTRKFKGVVGALEKAGISVPIKHICSSAGLIDLPEAFDMVRMGIALYGFYPSDQVRQDEVKLTPSMEVISHIVHLTTVPAGTPVSYGGVFVTRRPTRVATVGIGYADGYPRALSDRGRMIVRGHYAPVIGRVCMDLCMIDVTDIPGVRLEDSVIVMGSDGNIAVTAEELGELSGTVNYEIICSFKKRVARVYYRGGKPVNE